jgi:hypothetical protein
MKKAKKTKTLLDLYNAEGDKPTPKEAFILKVSEICCRHPQTVKMWLCGAREPEDLVLNTLREKFGVTSIR